MWGCAKRRQLVGDVVGFCRLEFVQVFSLRFRIFFPVHNPSPTTTSRFKIYPETPLAVRPYPRFLYVRFPGMASNKQHVHLLNVKIINLTETLNLKAFQSVIISDAHGVEGKVKSPPPPKKKSYVRY